MHWRSTFVHGLGTLELSLPVGLWRHSVITAGVRKHSGSGIPAAARKIRKDALVVPVRFWESEWPALLELLAWGQSKAPFTWILDTDDPIEGHLASAEVWLDAPRVGEQYAPERDPDYPRVMVLELTLRRVGGEAWDLTYFPLDPAIPQIAAVGDSPISLGATREPYEILITDDGAVIVADGHVITE